MSTKCSIFFDSKTHIYQECFDEKSIYIDIEEENLFSRLKLGLVEIIALVKCFDYQKLKKMSEITDENIESYCKNCVKQRLLNLDNISLMFSDIIYGHPSLSVAEQVENGTKFYKNKRNDLKKAFEFVESKPARWAFYSDLNDLIS
jgi:hypothetical protein